MTGDPYTAFGAIAAAFIGGYAIVRAWHLVRSWFGGCL